ncbi:helix-turn-helix domain-containing protein [Candidatus Pacearchaeota archaeon]|nr:helix-turn-helix domain-containing protein [Candidatus Pacearchaeota archaeon]
MGIVNEITMKMIKDAKDGESVRSLANRIGFSYSAVYNWVLNLERYEVIRIIKKGNKNVIKINKNLIYKKFIELENAVSVIEKDNDFWKLIRDVKLNIKFVKGTAIAIWTKGGFITGDFYDKIYFLEVFERDVISLKKILEEKNIAYTEEKLIEKRPLVFIIPKKSFKIEKVDGLATMPLKKLVSYCKRLSLDNILEQLDLLYNLNLSKRYSEIYTNIGK